MRSLKGVVSTPWLVLRVFNEILFNYEKKGGCPRPQRQLQVFHDALADCDLLDMGFKGDIFTGQRWKIWERLHRRVTKA